MSEENTYVFRLRDATVETYNELDNRRSTIVAEEILRRVEASRQVLILGDPGLGKSMIAARWARRMHLTLHRADQSSRPLSVVWRQWFDERNALLGTTEVEYFGKRRVDADFRKRVIDYWGRRCAITGLADEELLEACHIKPWARCTDEERLDVCNGMPLTPNLHKLFDCGRITLAYDGTVIVSASLGEWERKILGLDAPLRVYGLTDAHRRYLCWQRQVFEARERREAARTNTKGSRRIPPS
jgi:hypothetical protein